MVEIELFYQIHIDNCVTLPGIEDVIVDLIFTSPPYTPGLKEYGKETRDLSNLEIYDFFNQLKMLFCCCEEILKPGGFIIVNCANVRQKDSVLGSEAFKIWIMLNTINNFKFVQELIWIKPTFMEGQINPISSYPHPGYYHAEPRFEYMWVFRKEGPVWRDKDTIIPKDIWDEYRSNVWNICPIRSDGSRMDHPATFPIKLAELVITFYSPQGGVVLDPFGGTGTTLEAAFKLKRSCITHELYPKYLLNMVGPEEGMKLLRNKGVEITEEIMRHKKHLNRNSIKGRVPFGIKSLENNITWRLEVGEKRWKPK